MKHFFPFALWLALFFAIACSAKADDKVAMTIDGREIMASEFFYLYHKNSTSADNTLSPHDFASSFALFKMKVYEAEDAGFDTLPAFKHELEDYYRTIDDTDANLRREYRDGMLLFEITQRKVWHRSLLTDDNLCAHFESNRQRYVWAEPRAKGWVLYADDQATATEACHFLEQEGYDSSHDVRVPLRKRFGNRVFAGKFIVKQGLNPVIDALVFNNSPSCTPTNGWNVAVAFNCRIIHSPEQWQDVRGEVANDYQEHLAELWEQELWKNHKVEFHFDVIDSLSEI